MLRTSLPCAVTTSGARPARAAPAAESALGRCRCANGVDDEVGAALEQEVEQPAPAEQTGRPPQQGDEPRLVEADRAGGLDRLADARRHRAAGTELPDRIEPLSLVVDGDQLAALAETLDLARVDAQPAREPRAGQCSGEGA